MEKTEKTMTDLVIGDLVSANCSMDTMWGEAHERAKEYVEKEIASAVEKEIKKLNGFIAEVSSRIKEEVDNARLTPAGREGDMWASIAAYEIYKKLVKEIK
jgi:hypothetical protein